MVKPALFENAMGWYELARELATNMVPLKAAKAELEELVKTRGVWEARTALLEQTTVELERINTELERGKGDGEKAVVALQKARQEVDALKTHLSIVQESTRKADVVANETKLRIEAQLVRPNTEFAEATIFLDAWASLVRMIAWHYPFV